LYATRDVQWTTDGPRTITVFNPLFSGTQVRVSYLTESIAGNIGGGGGGGGGTPGTPGFPPGPPIVVVPPPPPPPPDPTDPGDQTIVGYGYRTTGGGTNGTLYPVSNWSQFKDAVLRSGPRIIRITGSGDLDGNGESIKVVNGDLTIDGTGWTGSMKDYKMVFECSNVLIRQVAWRPGEGASSSASSDRRAVSFNAGNNNGVLRNIVFDHCSFAWGPDVVLSMINNVEDWTIQHCVLGPALLASNIPSSPNGYGSNITTPGNSNPATMYVKRGTVYRNLMIMCNQRNLKYEYADGIDAINNAVYDWGNQAGHGNARGLNVVGGMYKKGPETTGSSEIWEPDTNYAEFNNSTYFPLSGADANIGIGFSPTVDIDVAARRSTYYNGGLFRATVTTASSGLFTTVVSNAGRTYQDGVDSLIKGHALAGTSDGFYNGPSTGNPPFPFWP
jgi:hypothetical protein